MQLPIAYYAVGCISCVENAPYIIEGCSRDCLQCCRMHFLRRKCTVHHRGIMTLAIFSSFQVYFRLWVMAATSSSCCFVRIFFSLGPIHSERFNRSISERPTGRGSESAAAASIQAIFSSFQVSLWRPQVQVSVLFTPTYFNLSGPVPCHPWIDCVLQPPL